MTACDIPVDAHAVRPRLPAEERHPVVIARRPERRLHRARDVPSAGSYQASQRIAPTLGRAACGRACAARDAKGLEATAASVVSKARRVK